MKDAFKNEIKEGDKVIYSTSGCGGTYYHVGKVVKLFPYKRDKTKNYNPPDRVEVKVKKSSKSKFTKNPLVYALNVVVLPVK